jgi:hypothetical protein
MVKNVEHWLNAYRALREALADRNAPADVCDDFRPAADLAYSKLSAIFAENAKFNDAWLGDLSEGSYDEIRSQLLAWLQDHQWYKEKYKDREIRTRDAKNARECRKAIRNLTKDGIWVFVRMLR